MLQTHVHIMLMQCYQPMCSICLCNTVCIEVMTTPDRRYRVPSAASLAKAKVWGPAERAREGARASSCFTCPLTLLMHCTLLGKSSNR